MQSRPDEKTIVIGDFLRAHPSPKAQDIVEWQRRYPDYRDDILSAGCDAIHDRVFGAGEDVIPWKTVARRLSKALFPARGSQLEKGERNIGT